MSEHYIRQARASFDDIQRVRVFCNTLSDLMEDGASDNDVLSFLDNQFQDGLGSHYDRILFGYETLVNNACDTSLSYLDWKPEIKAAMEMYAQAQRLSTDVLQRILEAVNAMPLFPETECLSYAGGYGE